MELPKVGIDVSFAEGLDQKTDPKRVSIGKFLSLENSIFDKGGQLQKRNGYGFLPSLPNASYNYVTTFAGNLTAIGTNIAALSAGSSSWVSRGAIQPLSLSTLPLLRNNLNQTAADSAVSDNGLVCTAYIESNGSSLVNKYVIADATTGQNVVAPSLIPIAVGAVSGGMRVFYLGTNFIIVFTNILSGTPHLQYVAINAYSLKLLNLGTDIASSYVPATTLSWDGYVAGGRLYVAYDTSSGGQAVKVAYLSAGLVLSAATRFGGYTASQMSVTADLSGAYAYLYVSFYNASTGLGYTAATDSNLNVVMSPVPITASMGILNITSAAQNGQCRVFAEYNNTDANTGLACHYIASVGVTPSQPFRSVFASGATTLTITAASGMVSGMTLIDNTTPGNIAAGTTITFSGANPVTTVTLSSATAGASAASPGDSLIGVFIDNVSAPIVVRSLGLASKAFIINGVIYLLGAYQSAYQPTYFVVNATYSVAGFPVIAAKLAYENGGGYLTKGLPGVTVTGTTAQIAYLYKDLISAVNKNTNVPSGTQVNGIYSQTGVNLASFTFGTQGLDTAEIGNDLHLTGGFLWMYDGYLPVEHNFFLFPDVILPSAGGYPSPQFTTATSGGFMAAETYYYQMTYEWTDNQGNAFRSAPSIPVPITTTGSTSTVTIYVPTLRLTMKTANPVKLVIYRWSTNQQNYYQVTSVTSPLLNDPTQDSVAFIDTLSDSSILGNNLLYTTGGVVEDVNAPASNLMTLFDTRLWLVDAEDPNLLWYSKQVIEATPVEMSDLFTIYVPPTTATQGSTGPITALAVMDDKLIIFKRDAIYYINGTGPDNTGLNSNYSPATFITSSVGSTNQNSIALTPQGLMFQSDKGIWMLGRGLDTEFIGAPVEDATASATVNSVVGVPGTNQIRFTMSSGITLMYDYYYGQWGTFVGVPAISSCIYQKLHTFIDQYGRAFQETVGSYLDGSNPVLMQFQTGPLRLDQLQAYQRVYFFYLLGTYISPHKLLVSVTYDYAQSPSHSVLIQPTNYNGPFGTTVDQSPFGQQATFGGNLSLEDWRVFTDQQRCRAMSITVQEVFDPTYGTVAGAGLTLSGINVVCGFKKGFYPQSAAHSVG